MCAAKIKKKESALYDKYGRAKRSLARSSAKLRRVAFNYIMVELIRTVCTRGKIGARRARTLKIVAHGDRSRMHFAYHVAATVACYAN